MIHDTKILLVLVLTLLVFLELKIELVAITITITITSLLGERAKYYVLLCTMYYC